MVSSVSCNTFSPTATFRKVDTPGSAR
jgi:hypothetical protein